MRIFVGPCPTLSPLSRAKATPRPSDCCFAVIWFYVLQILKCFHGGCGRVNKQQLSPISGGQLLTKSTKMKKKEEARVRNCCKFIKSRIGRNKANPRPARRAPLVYSPGKVDNFTAHYSDLQFLAIEAFK